MIKIRILSIDLQKDLGDQIICKDFDTYMAIKSKAQNIHEYIHEYFENAGMVVLDVPFSEMEEGFQGYIIK